MEYSNEAQVSKCTLKQKFKIQDKKTRQKKQNKKTTRSPVKQESDLYNYWAVLSKGAVD